MLTFSLGISAHAASCTYDSDTSTVRSALSALLAFAASTVLWQLDVFLFFGFLSDHGGFRRNVCTVCFLQLWCGTDRGATVSTTDISLGYVLTLCVLSLAVNGQFRAVRSLLFALFVQSS